MQLAIYIFHSIQSVNLWQIINTSQFYLSVVANVSRTHAFSLISRFHNLQVKMSKKYPEYKGLNLPNVASAVLDKWNTSNVFDRSISTREGKTPYIFFEGPPSANGLPGIHHVMARSIKDIFCRYKTLKGFQVKRKAGWIHTDYP